MPLPTFSFMVIMILLFSCRHTDAPDGGSEIKISSIKQVGYEGPYTDAHMHLANGFHNEAPFADSHRTKMDEIYKTEFEQLNNLEQMQGGLILTPTYLPAWSKLPIEARLVENREIIASASRYLIRDKRRFGFLCGVDVVSADALEFASACLSLPGIRGLKLRFSEGSQLWPVFEKLIAIAAQQKAIVLTHFPSGPSSGQSGFAAKTKGDPEETLKVMKVMARHPAAVLVIAHAGTASVIGLDGLATIGREYAKISSTNNIYTEISFAFKQADLLEVDDPNVEIVVDSWRAFGWDRLLFGTDAYTRHDGLPFLLEFLGADSVFPTEIGSLKPEESRLLLEGNFERFANDHL
jgi:hypothetical protein